MKIKIWKSENFLKLPLTELIPGSIFPTTSNTFLAKAILRSSNLGFAINDGTS